MWVWRVEWRRGVTGAERPRGGTECDRKNRLECSELWNAILWLGRNWRFSGTASGLRRGPQCRPTTQRLEEEVSALMLFLPLLSVVRWQHKGFYPSIDPCYLLQTMCSRLYCTRRAVILSENIFWLQTLNYSTLAQKYNNFSTVRKYWLSRI